MSEPFIFIATNKVRDGRSGDERLRAPGWVAFIRQHEPRLVAFHEYLSEDGAEAEYVQVHPDVESGPDVTITVLSDHLAGFTRTCSGGAGTRGGMAGTFGLVISVSARTPPG